MEKIKHSKVEIIEFGFYILGIVSSVFTICSTIVNGSGENKPLVLSLGCSTILLFCILVFLNMKSKKTYDKDIEYFTNQYHLINHLIRDEVYRVNNSYLEKKLTNEKTDHSLEVVTTDVVNKLSEIIEKVTKEKMSVNIKYCDYNENKEGVVRTLARSNNSDRNRSNDDEECKIDDREEYSQIFLCHRKSNYCSDNRKSKPSVYYKTKLVVPLRVLRHTDIKSKNKKHEYDVLGFVTIDCQKAYIFDDYFDIILNIMNGIADDICGFFLHYQHYSNLVV